MDIHIFEFIQSVFTSAIKMFWLEIVHVSYVELAEYELNVF